jgi:DNA-binding MarR family transcriptional regulator
MQRSQALSELGIGGGQVPYLFRICRLPGITQEELSRGLYVNKSTAARVITHLEKAGFVDRRPSAEDRRCLQLFPTEKALEVLPNLRDVVSGWNNYLLDEFTEEEKEALVSMLARVSKRAQAYIQREGVWDE